MAELRWTAPTRDDDADWADLLAAMERVDQRGETYTPEDLDDEWSSLWSHPETDATFVWDGPQLVAFAWLKTQPGQREANKVGCWGGVRPSHRRQGIGQRVLQWSLDRAEDIAVRLEGDLPTKVIMDASVEQVGVRALAERLGFEPVRHFLEIARPTADPVASAAAPDGLDLVLWNEALDASAHETHVEAFADHWGSEPRTVEEWTQWYTGHRGFRPDLSPVAVDRATGDVVAIVLCAAYPQDWDDLPVEAWINTVGTRRAWRGKGVARWLMSDALERIAAADTGFERAILGVDSDNPTGALFLYRSLGFEDVRAVTTLSRPAGSSVSR